jgi:hypothetical protein
LLEDVHAQRLRAICVPSPPLADRSVAREAGGPIVATLSYSFDEPIAELLEAARRTPDVRLAFTGRAPGWVRREAPSNCELTGWLSPAMYGQLLSTARGVICLTTREATMQTGAYEAVEYARPAILSGTRALRSSFDREGFIFVDDHEPSTIVDALRTLWRLHAELGEAARQSQPALITRSHAQVRVLAALIHTANSE